jgi:cellobiose-specific phosphotransferase system component IIA
MKRIWIGGIGLVLIIILVLLVAHKWHNQNIEAEKTAVSLRSGGKAISRARLRHAYIYAPSLFKEGERMYEAAMKQWKKENERWFFSRNYHTVIKMAGDAEYKINQALNKSREHRNKIQKEFEDLWDNLSGKIKDFESFYSFLPLPDDVRKKFVKGRMLFSEAQRAGDKGEFRDAYNKAKSASALIKPAHKFGKDKLTNYFKSFSKWDQLNDEALKTSHKDRVILVDKIARKCYVYKNGKVSQSFTTELGKNWVGNKSRQGDKSTPEGKYYVTKKLKGSQTIYHKALLINYPNDDDRARFASNQANGAVARNAKIGGLIEIHGGGGRGIDWTDGCVALTDKEMDKLFGLVDTGTPVYIVGSLVSLEKLKTRDSLKAQDEE